MWGTWERRALIAPAESLTPRLCVGGRVRDPPCVPVVRSLDNTRNAVILSLFTGVQKARWESLTVFLMQNTHGPPGIERQSQPGLQVDS